MADDPYLTRIAAKDVKPGMTLQVRELCGIATDYYHHPLYTVTGTVEKRGRTYFVPCVDGSDHAYAELRVSVRREKSNRIVLFNRTWAPLPEENLREVQAADLCALPKDEPIWCDYCALWSDSTTQDWFIVEQVYGDLPKPTAVRLRRSSGGDLFISPGDCLVRSRRFYMRKAVAPQRSRVVSLLEVES